MALVTDCQIKTSQPLIVTASRLGAFLISNATQQGRLLSSSKSALFFATFVRDSRRIAELGGEIEGIQETEYASLKCLPADKLSARCQWRWIKLARAITIPEQFEIRELPVWVGVVTMCSLSVFMAAGLSEFKSPDV